MSKINKQRINRIIIYALSIIVAFAILLFCNLQSIKAYLMAEKSESNYFTMAVIKKEAVFDIGANVNIKMKNLAGDNVTDRTGEDTNITAIKKSDTEPSSENKEEKNIVSASTSKNPIYMWYDSGTIYWWSEDEDPALNVDASYMFYELGALNDISGVSTFDTSSTEDMKNLFYRKYSNMIDSPKNIDALLNWDTSNVTVMRGMFSGWLNLTSVNFGEKFDTSNVTDMRAMFQHTYSLKTIDVSSFDTSKVSDFAGMFGAGMNNMFSQLEEIKGIENWDTSNATTMTSMFVHQVSLKTLDLSSWDTRNVTNLKGMFKDSTNLTTVDISSFDMTNVMDVSEMFSGCTSLSALKTPKAYPTNSSVAIALPKTLYDESGNGYTTLNNTSPTQIWIKNELKIGKIPAGDYIDIGTDLLSSEERAIYAYDWRVLKKSGSTVYVILSDYLPNSQIGETRAASMNMSLNENGYTVGWPDASGANAAVATLTTTSNWKFLIADTKVKDSSIVGTMPYSLIDTNGISGKDSLYIPHTESFHGCTGYWLSNAYQDTHISNVSLAGHTNLNGYKYSSDSSNGLRPVISVNSSLIFENIGENIWRIK